MNSFNVHILAASHTFYEGKCESLVVPTLHGQYGIMAGHCNTISAVVPGKMEYRIPGEAVKIAAVSSGLVKLKTTKCLCLSTAPSAPRTLTH